MHSVWVRSADEERGEIRVGVWGDVSWQTLSLATRRLSNEAHSPARAVSDTSSHLRLRWIQRKVTGCEAVAGLRLNDRPRGRGLAFGARRLRIVAFGVGTRKG